MSPEFRNELIEGMAARDEFRHHDMLQHGDALICMDPQNFIGYSMKAQAYIFLKRPQEALPFLDKAIECDPHSYDSYLLRGMIHYGNLNFASALTNFNFLIEHKQNLMKAFAVRSKVFLRQGQWQMAIKDMEKAEKLGWKDVHDSYYTGIAWFMLEDYTRALYFLDKATHDLPGDFQILFARGKIHYALKHWKQCEEDMSKTLYLNGGEKKAYVFRANAKIMQGNTEGGAKDIKALYDIDPEMAGRIAHGMPDPDEELFFFPDIN